MYVANKEVSHSRGACNQFKTLTKNATMKLVNYQVV